MANHRPLCLSPWRRHNTTIPTLQNPLLHFSFFSLHLPFSLFPLPFFSTFPSAFKLMSLFLLGSYFQPFACLHTHTDTQTHFQVLVCMKAVSLCVLCGFFVLWLRTFLRTGSRDIQAPKKPHNTPNESDRLVSVHFVQADPCSDVTYYCMTRLLFNHFAVRPPLWWGTFATTL